MINLDSLGCDRESAEIFAKLLQTKDVFYEW
jgi:hypothetical protein